MSLEILRQSTHPDELTTEPLRGRTVAVLGYGNQGAAHAQNLRDSGIDVVVGSRAGSEGARRAEEAGLRVIPLAEATATADLVVLALPDEVQPEVYRRDIAPNLKRGATIGFLHGFNIRFGLIEPPDNVGVVLVAPKGPGTLLRDLFVSGRGLPCLFAVDQQSPTGNAEALGLAWATGIGAGRAGVVRTTFAHETETDLFGEQSVLCGGTTWLILAAYETLIEAGYPPQLAYLETCHELKQIADLIYQRGLAGMNRAISNTAEFGAFDAGPRIVDSPVRDAMRRILEDIRNGEFARRFRADAERGFQWFEERRAALKRHSIEQAGADIRALMPWLEE